MKFKSLILATMIVVTLFAGVIVVGMPQNEAKALSSEYHGEPDTIYYFYDFYQSIEEMSLMTAFVGYNVVFDHNGSLGSDFTQLVNQNYFDNFGDNCVVVIDIKSFLPDCNILMQLFMELKMEQGCTTIFVTLFDKTDFENQSFLTYLDMYFKSDANRLYDLCDGSVEYLINNNGGLNNTTILIDRNLVDINTHYGAPISVLCEDSFFLKQLLSTIGEALSLGEDYDVEYQLCNYRNIRLLVHYGTCQFVDIISWNTYTAHTIDALEENVNISWNYICGIGAWYLNQHFYDFLLDAQTKITLPVFVIEVDPIVFGNGLTAIVYGACEDCDTSYNDGKTFLDALYEILYPTGE